jgi:hypothetical protein
VSEPAASHEISDIHFDDVAAPKLTVDREIEHRTVAHPPLLIQPESDRPHLLRFQGSLGANLSARIPWSLIIRARIILGVSHSRSPFSQ